MSAQSLSKLVRLFIAKRRPSGNWWTGPKPPENLSGALDAALGLRQFDKIHDHQRRVGRAALLAARARLKRVQHKIRKAGDFEEIHDIVRYETKDVHKFGELATYDVADRIGEFLNLRPAHVYLHAGTRNGAKAFGATGRKVSSTFFPKALRKLSPAEIEDFLCIFADQLNGRVPVSVHVWCGTSGKTMTDGCPPRSRRKTVPGDC